MIQTAKGTFQICMKPTESFDASLGRMTFDKGWDGDLKGEGAGEMLSVGDPNSGTAAYAVLEVFDGMLNGLQGGLAFHQYGTLVQDELTLTYQIVPASGSGELTGITCEHVLNALQKCITTT